MTPVKVTVRSKLPDFCTVNIREAEVDLETTWQYFLLVHGVPNFNPRAHVIKTNRGHTAYGNDTIQATAALFTRGSFHVWIHKIGSVRPRHLAVRSTSTRVHIGMGTRNRSSRISTGSDSTVANARTTREQGIRIRGSSILSQSQPTDISSLLQGDVVGLGSTATAGIGTRPSFLVEDDTMSQDSQDADEANSSLKDRLLTIVRSLSNAKVEEFRAELRKLHAGDGIRGIRWGNKAPQIANFLNSALLHGN